MCEALHIRERGFGAELLSVARNSLSLADLLPVLVSVARLKVRGPGLTFLSLSRHLLMDDGDLAGGITSMVSRECRPGGQDRAFA